MAAGTGHLKGAFDVFLTLDFRKIKVEGLSRDCKFLACVHNCRFYVFLSAQKVDHLSQIFSAIDIYVVDHSGFRGVGFRHYHRLEAGSAGLDGHR